ncbi:hypothetical protein CI109_104103 [Kwoniella shandongensis]|uniref:Uncharacterized protein n=1 Tax=Kwoniella shandongensis TaxID=1734106 RepID=A0A5M6C5S3_9TREE|nr:uncharacterized protein CI109_002986 [Kwoniella shandongensis]KAA5528825.1 hypothetical protein CI109_002986 [Kwoniella shandongensis]
MSTSNPSHLLISRNPPRSPAHPQLAHASTSQHHGHLTSSPPQAQTRPTILGRWHHSADELTSSASHNRHISEPFNGRAKGHDGTAEAESGDDDDEGVGGRGGQREYDEVISVHPTFLHDAAMPGKVKVIVGRNEFWCHKEILWFASPFFQGLLEGNWAETNHGDTLSVLSSSYVEPPSVPNHPPSSPPTDTDPPSPAPITSIVSHARPPISQRHSSRLRPRSPPSHPDSILNDDHDNEDGEGRRDSVYLDATEDSSTIADILRDLRESPNTPLSDVRNIGDVLEENTPTLSEVEGNARVEQVSSSSTLSNPAAMSPPQSGPTETVTTDRNTSLRPTVQRSSYRPSFSSSIRPLRASTSRVRENGAEAVVELHEESASAFQDFLFWAYPHLECRVTWTNVENLLALSSKLIVPALQKLCEHFLLTHASGRPVMALCLAEEHGNAELYREASRFVLDQPTWDSSEIETLSEQTQLKLSKRRNWFLERLLKLGSIDVKKEYTCRADCPDPARCQAQLDEKWRQAHMAVCRYGPPQPSVAFRCLRQLETFPTNPSLVMPHPLCQTAAKTWVMSLFDRMFQPKLVFSNPGTEKYWLWISMN